ncbi:MAG: AAA family ATPase [Lachnospiraceae bacterium]
MQEEKDRNPHVIITITRQFGSLGRPIAKKLSEKLGIDYYDRELVDRAASECNLATSQVGELEESGKLPFFSMKYPLGRGTSDLQDQIFETQRLLIQQIATKKSCIIVGRCGDSILREFPNALHIYLYAPEEERLAVCISRFHYTKPQAQKMLRDVDAARVRYHKKYAGYRPDDPRYQDLMVDTSVLGPDGTADLLETYVRAFEKGLTDPARSPRHRGSEEPPASSPSSAQTT